jgi:TM2 domain-containing membrane protein YozV
MRKIFICTIFFCSVFYGQENDSGKIDIYSPSSIKKFADYLFCQSDYLRSSEQYEIYLSKVYNDTVAFKVGLGYEFIGNYKKSLSVWKSVNHNSVFFDDSKFQIFKTFFLLGDNSLLLQAAQKERSDSLFKYYINVNQLAYASYLLSKKKMPSINKLKTYFNGTELYSMEKFYNWKNDPPYKSPVLALVMSAVIPGLGKIYSDQIGDGIAAFIVNSLFGYLAYYGFHDKRTFEGVLFTAVGGFFYAGNVYGSYSAAQIYNAKITFDFTRTVRNFLSDHNYFGPVYNFCK